MKPETIKDLRELEKRNRGYYPTNESLEKVWAALPELLGAAENAIRQQRLNTINTDCLRSLINRNAWTQEQLLVLADENADLQGKVAFQQKEREAILDLAERHVEEFGEALQENKQLQADLTCRNEQYRQAVALIQVQREEIAAKDARFTAPIVCLCGSTRFKQTWIAENARLTGEGNIVLAVGLWGHHERQYPDEATKAFLDALHKRKIDLCDWVWVLDVNGYIGESTRSEIDYAVAHGKPVRRLSVEFPEYVEPVDPMVADLAAKNKEIESLDWQLNDERAACDDWETDFNEERRQKEAAQEERDRYLALLTEIATAKDHTEQCAKFHVHYHYSKESIQRHVRQQLEKWGGEDRWITLQPI